MVQIIPRVIFTLPSTISKKENDFITFLFWFPLYFYLLHQWRPTWLPCWRWNRELCWHWQFCGIWKVARITSLGLKCITDFSLRLTKGSRNEDGNYQFLTGTLTSSCLYLAWAGSHRRWPPGAAWASGHFWSPPRCSQSGSQLFLSESWPRLWRSEQK